MANIRHRFSSWVVMAALIVIAAATIFAGNAVAQGAVDYDTDDDGLIDVANLAQLNAIRWDPDGDGTVVLDNSATYAAAFPGAKSGMGCNEDETETDDQVCLGYELTADLDFDTNDDGRTDIAGDDYWNDGKGWAPIATFNATFDGNRHTISNLYINVARTSNIGLFGIVETSSELKRAGVVNANVSVRGNFDVIAINVGALAGINRGKINASFSSGVVVSRGDVWYVGGLVGANSGTVSASYSTATVDSGHWMAGGLAGSNRGTITTSYATGRVSGEAIIGGLLGYLGGGSIVDSYATGQAKTRVDDTGGLVGLVDVATITRSYSIGLVSGKQPVGGLIGRVYLTVNATDSYWDTETSGRSTSAGGVGKTTAELQAPTSNTGIYSSWSTSTWDFGKGDEYPILKVDFDGDGTATWQEFGKQRIDYDADDDGLIEVSNLAQLNAIRWDLNGDGSPDNSDNHAGYITAFIDPVSGMGCNEDETDANDQVCVGYELSADLDFDTNGDGRTDIAGDAYWNKERGWEPIGVVDTLAHTEFNAVFDGNGHTISNLYINRISTDYLGLFGATEIDSEIRNVGLVNAQVNGSGGGASVGGLVGYVEEGKIKTSYVTGTIHSDGDYVGGLAGRVANGVISASYATASVKGDDSVGGLVGRINSGTISDGYAMGPVTAGNDVGGLVGENSGATITRSYATGAVVGVASVGGLLGQNSLGTITASYWATDTSGQSTSAAGVGKTTSELQTPTSNAGIYAGWSASQWDFGGAIQYPALKADVNGDGIATSQEFGQQRNDYDRDDDGLIEVYSLAELNAMRWDLDGSGVADDSNNGPGYRAAYPMPETDMGCPSDGCDGYELMADLDFDTNNDGRTDIAGDAYWNGGTGWAPIGDYQFENNTGFNAIFEGNGRTISNMFIGSASSQSVGLFGATKDASVIRNLGLVNALVAGPNTVNGVGALVGYHAGLISTCYVTGSVEDAVSLVGGMVGHNAGTIRNSYSAASVEGSDHAIGGLAGLNAGMIDSSYATGPVKGKTNVAGLVGTNYHLGAITSSYSTGEVSGAVATGGLVAANSQGTVTNSYWDTVASGQPTSQGGVGKTTAELQSPTSNTGIYSAWNATYWDFGGAIQYPALVADWNGDGTATAEEFGQQRIDYDVDDDGLIEVSNLAQLNAIRWNLNGDGEVDSAANRARYTAAFPKSITGKGCPTDACRGYELTANLDFDTNGDGKTNVAGDAYWNGGSGWTPIGAYHDSNDTEFNATFDGNGHTISNLFISGSGSDYLGLFGTANSDSVIFDVGLVNAQVNGSATDSSVGILVGYQHKGSIAATFVTGSVTGDDEVGGLVGTNDGTIEISYSTASVSGNDYVGGLTGSNTGTITSSYATGSVSGDDQVGGLVGDNDSGEIETSYSAGAVSGDHSVGGLAGSNNQGTITHSYWDLTASGQTTSAGGVGKTTAQLQSPTSASGIYADWSAGRWDFGRSVQYPALVVDFDGDDQATALEFGPQRIDYDADDDGLIEVSTLAQLNAIRWDLDGDGASDADNNEPKYLNAFLKAASDMGCPATGCDGYELSADLDFDTNDNGRGDSGDDYWNHGGGWEPIGVYSLHDDTEFNAVFEGNGRTLSNLFINREDADDLGLFGWTETESEIRNVGLVDAKVRGINASDNVGALVGTNQGDITAIYASGTVRGRVDVGALVGYNSGTLMSSFATVSVSGQENVGGLVGVNTGTLLSTYATGSVDGNNIVGGLAGYNTRGDIEDSYAIGSVTGEVIAGGLVSLNVEGAVADSYWDTGATGQSASEGGVGKTTAELRGPTSNTGIYANWDAGTWDFATDLHYPAIKADFNGDGIATAAEFGGQVIDYDADDDGLLEVSNLAQLNAIRWDQNGDGVPADADGAKYVVAFPNSDGAMGCPSGVCVGYELTTDLDFDTNGNGRADSGDAHWNGGAGWSPIWSYSGVLEGNGYAIKNLYLNRKQRGRSGLFSRLTDGAVARNLALVGVNITSNGDAGAFAGLTTRAAINNSYATGTVTIRSNNDSVGGFVGEASGHPSGHDTIRDSYSLVRVAAMGVGNRIGGLVGSMHVNQSSHTRIVNSFAAGAVQTHDPTWAGGLVGKAGIPESRITDSYWDTQTSGWSTSSDDGDGKPDDGLGKNKQELQSPTSAAGIYANWNPAAWDFGSATQYPALKFDTNGDGVATVAEFGNQPRTAGNFVADIDLDDDGLIEVSTLAQLNAIRWDPEGDGSSASNKEGDYRQAFAAWNNGAAVACVGASCVGYELTADLDFDTNDNGRADSGDAYWNGGAGWEPIDSYSGILEGNGHAIANLHVNRPGSDATGLFGQLTNEAEVRNLPLTNVDITSGGDAGAFAGRMTDAGISHSYATGEVIGNGDDTSVGGLVGEASGHLFGGDTFRDSYSLVKVTSMGSGSAAGGLAGTLSASGARHPQIVNSYSAGLVQTTEPGKGGGLAGEATDLTWALHSYYDRETSGWETSAAGGRQTQQRLQTPKTTRNFFARWGSSVWDFGNHSQYPALKYDTNRDGTATVAEFGSQPRTATIPSVDLDRDNDGLIEIYGEDDNEKRTKLNAIRWDLDGDGVPSSNGDDYWDAFNDGSSASVPCVGALCHGYELMSDVGLGGSSNEWEPIGLSVHASFSGEFNGNGHIIRNLWQSRTWSDDGNTHAGLFGFTGSSALLHGVIMRDVDIEVWGDEHDDNGVNVAGALVAVNRGIVRDSAVENPNCSVVGRNVSGGLVGANHGTVEQSWSDCNWVKSFKGAGGLVGFNHSGATVKNSFVGVSTLAHNPRGSWYKGALVGRNFGRVETSYSVGETKHNSKNDGPMNGQQAGGGVTIDSYFFGKDSHESLGGVRVDDDAMRNPVDGDAGIFANWDLDLWNLGDDTQFTVLRVDTNGDGYTTPWELGGQRPDNAFSHRPDYVDGDGAHNIWREGLSLRFRKTADDQNIRVDGVGYRIAKTGSACHDWLSSSVVMLGETNGRARLAEDNGVYTLVLERRDSWAFRPNGRVCIDVWFLNTEGESSPRGRRYHDIHMPPGTAPRSKPIKAAEAQVEPGKVSLAFRTDSNDRVTSVSYRVASNGSSCTVWKNLPGTLFPGDTINGAVLNKVGDLWRLQLPVGVGTVLKQNHKYCVDITAHNDAGMAPNGRRWKHFVTGD